jgi:hypothetical protein
VTNATAATVTGRSGDPNACAPETYTEVRRERAGGGKRERERERERERKRESGIPALRPTKPGL